MQILDSRSKSEEIESSVIDILGYGQIDLAMQLLQDREHWISVYNDHKLVTKDKHSDTIYDNHALPKKQKVTKERNAEPDFIDRLLQDPQSLVNERNLILAENEARTHSSLPKRQISVSQKYPFVFDVQAEAKLTSSFLSGSRLYLPEGTVHERKDLWDSITLPIPEKAPQDVLQIPRVQVAQMDSLCQTALKGTEELNLIQSVVYKTAYFTRENLLVSAPTGAGKTNVALLCMLQLIKQHLNQGNLVDLEAFKIVYMAPMKALASEMTSNFSRKLAPLGLKVRECTGDMQLSKQELLETQVLMTTPEKWDVITRKGAGDHSLVNLVKLVIIDEVHLLHEDRGAVIEALVARMLRMVETTQSPIRIVGLSATLPNYVDVARFLCVNPYKGLFYFDSRFRPVPLGMSFMGVMVFVHARTETVRTARWLREHALTEGHIEHFRPPRLGQKDGMAQKKIQKVRDNILHELLPDGIGCHHAGMLRHDRDLVEQLFSSGQIRVLICTATLAWGVNLPAHAVVIKGTRVYDADKSDFVDLDILDVLQIFGRAGRPQFDSLGLATIITTKEKLGHYLSLITLQNPIESTLLKNLHDHLNAEIALATVSNMDEAVTWLSYTYLFIRLRMNPSHYGIPPAMLQRDCNLVDFLVRALRDVATELDRAEMIRFEPRSGQLSATDRGRTASLYYVKFQTAAMVKDELDPMNMESQLLDLLSRATEFASMKLREDEALELQQIRDDACRYEVSVQTGQMSYTGHGAAKLNASLGVESSDNPDEKMATAGDSCPVVEKKINLLLQSYISRYHPKTHSLVSDMYYVQQNASRLIRYIFEISLRRGWASATMQALKLAKMIEKRQWYDDSPLWQFVDADSDPLIERLEHLNLTIDRILDMDANLLGEFSGPIILVGKN
ncbi:activating signal cointegrator 1 complex subunit [Cichlidogyrus casuarinus]|uniref:Activating signal cointegrator 1 complex subunit n=1 Tax=Cichlidogyrus casuarinus TaxID=1844966 RepID=A0ABD2PZ29_9PLAT